MTISIWNRPSTGGSGQERTRRYGIVAVVLFGLVLGMGLTSAGVVNGTSAQALTASMPQAITSTSTTSVGSMGAITAATQSVTAAAKSPKYTTFKRAYGKWLPAGPGRPYGGWVGTFHGTAPDGTYMIGPCIDRNERMATATSIVTTKAKLAGLGEKKSKQLRFLSGLYSAKKSDVIAKRFQLAEWLIIDAGFDSYLKYGVKNGFLSKADIEAVNKMVAESKRHGPFVVKIKAEKEVGVTKSMNVTAVATIKKTGKRAPAGGVVKFKVSKNAKLISINGKKGATSGTTNSKGVAKAVIKIVDDGRVTVNGSVTYPSSTTVLINKTVRANSQRIIYGKFKETAKGKLTFEKKVSVPKINNECTEDCDGTATTKIEVCNDAANGPIKYVVELNGKLLNYLSVGSGKCVGKTYDLKDADKLSSTKYCHTAKVGGACTTGWKKISSSYVIECPAWATAEITVGCNCSKSWASVKFSAPADSPRFYSGRVVLTKDGVEVGNIPVKAIAAGKSVTVQIPMQVSAGLVIEARFSVFKDAEMKQPMVSDEVLTQVMVMKVAGKSVTYDKTTTIGGELVDSSTATVKIPSLKNN